MSTGQWLPGAALGVSSACCFCHASMRAISAFEGSSSGGQAFIEDLRLPWFVDTASFSPTQ